MKKWWWAHYLYGALSMALFLVNAWFGVMHVLFFHVYEFTEYFLVGDKLYLDLREFYAGAASVSALYLAASMFGAL